MGTTMSKKQLTIGLLGCGTVGGGLVELVARNRDLLRERSGIDFTISKILVRDAEKSRPGVDPGLITTKPEKVLQNGCDMVVELVGGIEPARSFIHDALAGRKHVVTANKALLAADGFNLQRTAEKQKVRFGFEASVCGGIPIIRALKSGLVGNQIQSLSGILNGTCNYILTRMEEDRAEFPEALRDAQAKGFAEADPTLDIDGHDAAQKLKILAELAFNGRVSGDSVCVEGIRNITADDLRAARELGCVIRHVATAEVSGNAIALRVEPVLLPESHQLSSVRNENNAVLVRGDAVGEMLFFGKGAGSLPTASAVLSDIVDIACHTTRRSPLHHQELSTTVLDHTRRHYLRFPVQQATAIGPITAALEGNNIGVQKAAAKWAKNACESSQVTVVTHACSDAKLASTLEEICASELASAKAVRLSFAE
jgi:homoserine dehydrogenase